jgi:hypothetical protein
VNSHTFYAFNYTTSPPRSVRHERYEDHAQGGHRAWPAPRQFSPARERLDAGAMQQGDGNRAHHQLGGCSRPPIAIESATSALETILGGQDQPGQSVT